MLWEWLQQILSQSIDYLKFWVIVDEFEEAVLLSWGKVNKIRTAGTYLKWPIRDYYLHTIVTYDTLQVDDVILTTSDRETVSVGCVVEYSIKDVRKFLIDTNEAKGNMKDVCRGILTTTLEEVSWTEITKKTVLNRIKKQMEAKFDRMGVEVIDVMITDKCKTKAFKLFISKQTQEIFQHTT